MIKKTIMLLSALIIFSSCANEKNSTHKEDTNVTSLSMTDLYEDAFLLYSDGVGTMTFNDALDIAEKTRFKILSSSETLDSGKKMIVIYSDDDDYDDEILIYTYPDDGTITTVSYSGTRAGKRFGIEIDDYLHERKTSISYYSHLKGLSRRYADSLQECETALFDEQNN